MSSSRSPRVLFYVQHLLGVGHLKRAAILAEAMTASGLDVTVALGGPLLADVPFRGARVAQLPPARIAGEDFSTIIDEAGRPADEAWRTARRRALLDLSASVRPDVLLIELFPFGRRQFRFELIPLLEAVHGGPERPRIACSVRDILVASKRPARDVETVDTLRRYFDTVLVHGDPSLIAFDATFASAPAIADLIRYTGYVTAPERHDRDLLDGDGEVLVSAGGGAVGGPLLFAALKARAMTALAENVWRLITGPNLPDADFERLRSAADGKVLVERFRQDFPARLKRAALSISQAGYNTTMDILRAGAPAVVVPYETAGETEQRLRADLLAAKGLLTVLPADALSPARLAAAVGDALARPAMAERRIDLSGAASTARLVNELAVRIPRASHPLR
jgi:predicted glycosyltransferase